MSMPALGWRDTGTTELHGLAHWLIAAERERQVRRRRPEICACGRFYGGSSAVRLDEIDRRNYCAPRAPVAIREKYWDRRLMSSGGEVELTKPGCRRRRLQISVFARAKPCRPGPPSSERHPTTTAAPCAPRDGRLMDEFRFGPSLHRDRIHHRLAPERIQARLRSRRISRKSTMTGTRAEWSVASAADEIEERPPSAAFRKNPAGPSSMLTSIESGRRSRPGRRRPLEGLRCSRPR